MDRKTPLVIITGPTCSGKTGVALSFARSFPIEVVSADSMQVYRHMDIATAKPTLEQQSLLAHHLIDVVDPDEEFNAGMFSSLAAVKIREIVSRGRVPVVVGGTGLYIKALVYGLSPSPPGSPELRGYFRSVLQDRGSAHLRRFLERIDPETAKKINKNDEVRVIRALETAFLTGVKPSVINRGHGFAEPGYDARVFCVVKDRDLLYRDIDERTARMMEAGLVEETEKLLGMGFGPDLRSMQTLAYKHVTGLLESRIDIDTAVANIRRDTRRYAKRQMTWNRSHYPQEVFCSPDEALKALAALLGG